MLNKTHLANFTAVYFKDGDFWVGFIEEISGVNSQGRTLKELKENLLEALQLVIKTNRDRTNSTQHNSTP